MLRREERSKVLTILRTSFMDGPSSNKACSCCWFPGLVTISRGVKEYKVGSFSFLCCFEQKALCLRSAFYRRSHLSEGLSFSPFQEGSQRKLWWRCVGAVGSLERRDTQPLDFPFEPLSNQHAQLVSMVNTSKYIHDREKIILHD